MKILLRPNIRFCSTEKISYNGENKIVETFRDNNQLACRSEYDKLGRDIHTNWFDISGNDAGFMHKKYLNDGYIETCKTPTQEYTRTTKKFIKDSFIHYTEEYISKTNPQANYFNEIIRSLSGKLVQIISNGKTIL